jgi:hypothetical protein
MSPPEAKARLKNTVREHKANFSGLAGKKNIFLNYNIAPAAYDGQKIKWN